MKRALRVVGTPADLDAAEATRVEVGAVLVSVADAHDGAAAARFARFLIDAGATPASESPDSRPEYRIVIRSTPESPEAHVRAEVLEESADVVLGSARAAFATAFVEAFGSGVNADARD